MTNPTATPPPATRLSQAREEDDLSVKFQTSNFNETLNAQNLSPLLFATDRNLEEDNQSNGYEVELVQPQMISAKLVQSRGSRNHEDVTTSDLQPWKTNEHSREQSKEMARPLNEAQVPASPPV